MYRFRFTFKIICFIVFFLMLSNMGYALHGHAEIDSLNRMMSSTIDLDKALELEKKIQRQAKKSHYYKGTIDCTIKIALKLNAAGRYGLLLAKLETINDLVLKYGNDDDKFLLSQLKGLAYWKIGFYDRSNALYDEALIYAQKERDIEKRRHQVGEVFLAKALNFRDSKSAPSDTVNYYLSRNFNEKMQVDPNGRFNSGIVNAGFYLCQFYINHKNLDSAKKYLDIVIKVRLRPGQGNARIEMNRFFLRGMFCVAKGEFKKSLIFLHSAMNVANTLKASYRIRDIALILSEAYAGLMDIEQERKWLRNYTRFSDSISRMEKITTNNSIKYLKPELDKNEKATSNHKILLVIILSCSFFVVGLGMFHLQRIKKVDGYNKKLSKKILVLPINIDEPEKRLSELKKVTGMAMSNDPGFFTAYNKYDPFFYKKLLNIAPGITASELKFCAYIKLNFDTKEIARYANFSVRAVESKKSRLRKKLGILSSTDLNIWMSQICD